MDRKKRLRTIAFTLIGAFTATICFRLTTGVLTGQLHDLPDKDMILEAIEYRT